jgi:hypothetical protein
MHRRIVEAVAAVPRTDSVYVFPGRKLGSPVTNATILAWACLVAEGGLLRIT